VNGGPYIGQYIFKLTMFLLTHPLAPSLLRKEGEPDAFLPFSYLGEGVGG